MSNQRIAEMIWAGYECDQGDSHDGMVTRAIGSIRDALDEAEVRGRKAGLEEAAERLARSMYTDPASQEETRRDFKRALSDSPSPPALVAQVPSLDFPNHRPTTICPIHESVLIASDEGPRCWPCSQSSTATSEEKP